jgi:ribosome-associated toxin RatA of RatAB toxin-antitoxin module
VVIDTLFEDNISIRAIVVDQDKICMRQIRFGFYDLKKTWKIEKNIDKDSLKLEFRSNAQTTNALLNVANPALLYKVAKNNMTTRLVYQESHEKVFYDCVWNFGMIRKESLWWSYNRSSFDNR